MTPALIVLAHRARPDQSLVTRQVVLSFGIPFALVPLVMLTQQARDHGRAGQPQRDDDRRVASSRRDHRPERLPAVRDVLASRLRAAMPLADDFQRDRRLAARDWTTSSSTCASTRRPLRRRGARTCAGQRVAASRSPTGTGASTSPTGSATPRRPRRCTATLKLLDDAGIEGDSRVREVRSGRVEVVQMWGRPESVRHEFRRGARSSRVASGPRRRVVPGPAVRLAVAGRCDAAGHEVELVDARARPRRAGHRRRRGRRPRRRGGRDRPHRSGSVAGLLLPRRGRPEESAPRPPASTSSCRARGSPARRRARRALLAP